jgi:hypothetical protein
MGFYAAYALIQGADLRLSLAQFLGDANANSTGGWFMRLTMRERPIHELARRDPHPRVPVREFA